MNCLLCGKDSKLKDANWTGYQSPQLFNIYHCDHCGTSFSFPQVTDSDIYNFIYRHSSKLPGYRRYQNFADTINIQNNPLQFLAEEEIYWGIAKVLKELVLDKQKAEIIDVGCGLGYLTYALRKENYNVTGVDISEDAIINAKSKFGDYYRTLDIFNETETSKKYDVVILTEVIEHVHNPEVFINQLSKLLKQNGKIIVTTPNKLASSLSCVWDTDLPPVHQWWFTKQSLKYLSEKLNLKISFVDFNHFYLKNYQSLKKSDANCNKRNVRPLLDKNGDVIYSETIDVSVSNYRKKLSQIKILRKIYNSFLRYFNWMRYVISGEGRIICVVLQK